MLGKLIGYFDDDNPADWEGWFYACAVVLGGVLFRCVLFVVAVVVIVIVVILFSSHCTRHISDSLGLAGKPRLPSKVIESFVGMEVVRFFS